MSVCNGRYTLSVHKPPGERAHLDLFLDTGEEQLVHYSLSLEQRRRSQVLQVFQLGRPHRRLYLNFTGQLAANRGRVRIISRGQWHKKSSLSGQKPLARVRLPERCASHARRGHLSR